MAAAEDEVRGRRQSERLFSRSNHDTLSPRLRPRKVAPLARRSRATSKSCVAIAIDDANGSFFGARAVARAFASRPRSVARGGERVFLRTLEPLDRVAERGHVF